MEKLSHAYIVSSASEAARTELSRALAAKMLCSSEGEKPCGVCRNCKKVRSGVHPDLTVISRIVDDKGNKKREILVDQIREMSLDAYILPNEAQGKVYIIEDADTMNISAQNAALKLFEEPPKNVYFILTAANTGKLLPTVRSRCAELRRNAEDESETEEAANMAEEYLACLEKNDPMQLLIWCLSNEGTDQRGTVAFLNAVKSRFADMLCGRREAVFEDRRKLMKGIELADHCLECLKVNTGIKHIFGLLAVKSLPAAETRK